MNLMTSILAILAAAGVSYGLIGGKISQENSSSSMIGQFIHSDVITSRVDAVKKADGDYQLANNYALPSSYAAMPSMPPDFSSYMSVGSSASGVNGHTRWVCFSTTISRKQWLAFQSAKIKMGPNAIISSTCGSTQSSNPVSANGTGSQESQAALTYWYDPLTPPTAPSQGGSLPLDNIYYLVRQYNGVWTAYGSGVAPSWCQKLNQQMDCQGNSPRHRKKSNNCTPGNFSCSMPAGTNCSQSSSGAVTCTTTP